MLRLVFDLQRGAPGAPVRADIHRVPRAPCNDTVHKIGLCSCVTVAIIGVLLRQSMFERGIVGRDFGVRNQVVAKDYAPFMRFVSPWEQIDAPLRHGRSLHERIDVDFIAVPAIFVACGFHRCDGRDDMLNGRAE